MYTYTDFQGVDDDLDFLNWQEPVAVYSNAGNDFIRGSAFDDVMFGGAGRDTLSGEDGDDWLFGERGNDILRGGGGDDKLLGGAGDDELWGGSGNDTLHGGSGKDVFFGQAGDDSYFGGSEADRFVFVLFEIGNDTIRDFTAGEDIIDLRATGITGFTDILAHSYQDGANTVIKFDLFGIEGTITLLGVDRAALSARDFEIL